MSKLFLKLRIGLKRLRFRGFSRGPPFYLGLFLVILFSLLLISLPKSKGLKENLIGTLTSQITNSQNVFLSSVGGFLLESPNLFFIQKDSLKAVSSPTIVNPKVFASLGDDSEPDVRKEILEYTVQSGDTLSKIAEDFGISLETVLWANDLSKNATISPGQKLIILPVTGALHP